MRIEGVDWAVLWFPLDGAGAGRSLTPAEHEVASHLLAGMSNAEIARKRRVSPRTVANQVACIYRKLRVRSRAELVGRAAHFGDG